MDDYLSPKEVAAELGISYTEVIDRINHNEIVATRKGWNYFIHKDEVARHKKAVAE